MLPSFIGTFEVGIHAAACANRIGTSPPTDSARRAPSPVLSFGTGEKCSPPRRRCGYALA